MTSGDAIYANQDLIKWIKQVLSLPSGIMKTGDNVYFFKSVDFKRDMLYISEEAFSRVIKLEKADAVIVSTDLSFPTKPLSLKDNKIDSNCPLEMADEIVYNVSSMGSNYLETFVQWFKLSELTKLPRIVFESELLNFINSGFVINEENYDSIVSMLRSDRKIACKTIDNCKISESLPYILFLIYFRQGLMNKDTSLAYELPNVTRYLHGKGCGNSISGEVFKELISDEKIGPRIMSTALEIAQKSIDNNSSLSSIKPYIDQFDINFSWKQ